MLKKSYILLSLSSLKVEKFAFPLLHLWAIAAVSLFCRDMWDAVGGQKWAHSGKVGQMKFLHSVFP